MNLSTVRSSVILGLALLLAPACVLGGDMGALVGALCISAAFFFWNLAAVIALTADHSLEELPLDDLKDHVRSEMENLYLVAVASAGCWIAVVADHLLAVVGLHLLIVEGVLWIGPRLIPGPPSVGPQNYPRVIRTALLELTSAAALRLVLVNAGVVGT
jgi:hypothetical protein